MGFNDFFESNVKKLKLDDYSIARVLSEHREAYKVRGVNGQFLAKITGKQKHTAQSREDFPVVGDWVAIKELDKERAVIQEIIPRKTLLKRKSNNRDEIQVIAANVDVAFVVESIDRDYSLNRIERYLVLAREGNIELAIVLNKIDLISKEELNIKVQELKDRFEGINIVTTSTLTEQGLDDLKKNIVSGRTYCFIGSSGVGKSSLINRMLPEKIIKVDSLSDKTKRGKHTTTTRDLYVLDGGGIVIDNPGTREVGMTNSGVGIEDAYREIAVFSKECAYKDCTHTHEPDCAVLQAIESGDLDEDKLNNYIKLKKESEHYNMTELGRRRKDKKFGKFIKQHKKNFRKDDSE